jgi:hypothetical protein
MARPRKVDTGAPLEVGQPVRHQPTGFLGVVVRYVSQGQRTVDWCLAPLGDDPPAVPDRDQDVAALEPVDEVPVAAFVPEPVQRLLDRFELAEQPDPNPPPRRGERGTHRQAARLWIGTALGCDDGHDFMTVVVELVGWKPNPNYGDWPLVVEWLKVHDPKTDPDESGRFFRYYRLTYLERSVYLAEYRSWQAARQDAWPSAA